MTAPAARQARYPRCLLATACVPWNEDWTLAEDLFRAEVRGLLAAGIVDLYVFGTAGEGYAVSERQFDQIVRVFREETTAPGVRPMVGITSLSLSTMIDRIERCASLGFEVFQITLPSWGTLNDHELDCFFAEVCSRFPRQQFLHSNLSRAGRMLGAREYRRLADAHPNLVATKLATADLALILDVVTSVPEVRHFLTEFNFAAASGVAECSLIISISAGNLERARAFYEAGLARDVARLDQEDVRELQALRRALHQAVAGTAHMDGAFDKTRSRLLVPGFPLRLLPPYRGLDVAVFDRVVAEMRRLCPAWLPPLDADYPIAPA